MGLGGGCDSTLNIDVTVDKNSSKTDVIHISMW